VLAPDPDLLASSYHFELPPESIAQHPVPRGTSRLRVVGPELDAHRTVGDLPQLLDPGDLLVVNDTKVRPAKLTARRPTGGAVHLLLLRPLPDGRWAALVKPSKKLREGARVRLQRRGTDELGPELQIDGVLPGGQRAVAGDDLAAAAEAWGEMPLPPYIQRDAPDPADRERYQTRFARHEGAAAAPTAGLHFSDSLLQELDDRGVHRVSVTLHVGLGTFQPMRSEQLLDHPMHEEVYRVPSETAAAVAACEARGGRIVCVGTTSLRALESWHRADRPTDGMTRSTRLFLHPGDGPRLRCALMTNFHLPGSTLLVLVASILGRPATQDLYAAAIADGYRFYSYGDALLLL